MNIILTNFLQFVVLLINELTIGNFFSNELHSVSALKLEATSEELQFLLLQADESFLCTLGMSQKKQPYILLKAAG